jgi:type IV fimbrial biogenesis protein FimT
MDVNFSPALAYASGSTAERQQGYTLIELFIGLAIAAVVVGMALPSFAGLMHNNRRTTAINTLSSTLNYARSEAIKRSLPAVICKGNPVDGCDKTRQWHDGWIVFVDENGDKAWSGDEPLLWTQDALAREQTLEWSAFPSSNYVIYYPNGSASSNGTFTFCDNRGPTEARSLIIARSGRVRVSDKNAKDESLQCPA